MSEAIEENTSERKIEMNRESVNCVFIGHVDAGKSTLCGNILCLTGNVDSRALSKHKKEAKELNRESWHYAYVMDSSDEEKAKGKTVDIAKEHFKTEKRQYTILDAPGHKSYVPNMINGAILADVAILVVSARVNEFEAGFQKQGQTREHVLLAKSLGVSRLIVVINKMDDPSVNWSQERYNYIVNQLKPFICKLCGYRIKKGTVTFLPISSFAGANIIEPMNSDICSWYNGCYLTQALDNMTFEPKDLEGSLRIPVFSKNKLSGLLLDGKVERGTVRIGDKVAIGPINGEGVIKELYLDSNEEKLELIESAKAGFNVRIRLNKEFDFSSINKGDVISSIEDPCPVGNTFICVIALIDGPESTILTCGFEAVMHIHTTIENCSIDQLYQYDSVKNKITKNKLQFSTKKTMVGAKITIKRNICLEKFDNLNQMGQFVLRSGSVTVGVGRILMLPKS